MNQLAPCPHCKRHVRVTERSCPFCEASLDAGLAGRARPSVSTRGLSRASILALGASMAAAMGAGVLEGCADEPDPDGDDDKPAADGGLPPGTGVPVYGAPVQPDAGSNNPPQRPDGGMVAIYGAPVQPDGGRVQPVYGAPIQPLDASQNDAGASDAGVSDAGKDAATSSDAGKDAGRLDPIDDGGRVAPVYGAPVPFYGAPVQPSIKTDAE
jgi:hypothetical protein